MNNDRGVSVVLEFVRRVSGWIACAIAVYAGLLAWQYYSATPGQVRRHHLESAWFLIAALGVLHARISGDDQEAPAEDPWAGRWLALIATLAGGATLWLYWPALDFGFLSDDFVLLTRAINHEWIAPQSAEFIRPVPLLAWALIARALGHHPVWFHALNLMLHTANTVLVFVLARQAGMRLSTSSAVAAVFLVNPISVEAVAWASGVQDLLMTTMCLLFVLAAFSRRTLVGPSVAVSSLVVGVLSKETAIVAPMIALLAWVASGRLRRVSDLRVVGVGMVLCSVYVAWRVTYIDLPAAFVSTPSGYMLKELVSRPFAGLAVPWRDRVLDAHPILGVASVLFFSFLVVLRAGRRRTVPPRLLAVLPWAAWVVVSVLPVYAYLYISPELQGSRYLYLGTCGWAMLVVLLIQSAVAGRRQPFPAIGIVLAATALVAGWAGTRSSLQSWYQADRLSGTVIEAAVRTISDHACAAYAFEDLPDSVEGAYVFRNGFREALQMRVGITPTAQPGSAESRCRFRWDGRTFIPPLVQDQPRSLETGHRGRQQTTGAHRQDGDDRPEHAAETDASGPADDLGLPGIGNGPQTEHRDQQEEENRGTQRL